MLSWAPTEDHRNRIRQRAEEAVRRVVGHDKRAINIATLEVAQRLPIAALTRHHEVQHIVGVLEAVVDTNDDRREVQIAKEVRHVLGHNERNCVGLLTR